MEVLVSSMGGSIERSGPRALRCEHPGAFISFLLWCPLVLWSLGLVALLGGAVAGAVEPIALLGLGPALPMMAFFAWLLRRRRRTMGAFELDVDAGQLHRTRGGDESWPLEALRFGARWDPFHRGFGAEHWLVAEVPDGRALRLGKGPKVEVQAVLRLLSEWGLRVDAPR
jgi:hypothetical protein